jgi:hypothetical protein
MAALTDVTTGKLMERSTAWTLSAHSGGSMTDDYFDFDEDYGLDPDELIKEMEEEARYYDKLSKIYKYEGEEYDEYYA